MSLAAILVLFVGLSIQSVLSKCPVVPQTQLLNLTRDTRTLEILLVVHPYWKSYLFHENITGSTIKCFRVSVETGKHPLSISYWDPDQTVIRGNVMATDKMEPVDGSITLNTKIMTSTGFGSTCYEAISEVVRIWIEGNFVIIWSCREEDHKDNIGILFLVYTPRENYKYHNNQKASKDLLKEYKTFAGKFLTEPYLKMISWDKDPGLDICEPLNPYGTCVNKVSTGSGKSIYNKGTVKKPEESASEEHSSGVKDPSKEDNRGVLFCGLIVILVYLPLIVIEVQFLK